MTPTEQVIELLENEPQKWCQREYTLRHANGTEIWTANLFFIDIKIYQPLRRIGFIEKIKLQRAVNKWHKAPLKFK